MENVSKYFSGFIIEIGERKLHFSVTLRNLRWHDKNVNKTCNHPLKLGLDFLFGCFRL